jgi:hypothetical protein
MVRRYAKCTFSAFDQALYAFVEATVETNTSGPHTWQPYDMMGSTGTSKILHLKSNCVIHCSSSVCVCVCSSYTWRCSDSNQRKAAAHISWRRISLSLTIQLTHHKLPKAESVSSVESILINSPHPPPQFSWALVTARWLPCGHGQAMVYFEYSHQCANWS